MFPRDDCRSNWMEEANPNPREQIYIQRALGMEMHRISQSTHVFHFRFPFYVLAISTKPDNVFATCPASRHPSFRSKRISPHCHSGLCHPVAIRIDKNSKVYFFVPPLYPLGTCKVPFCCFFCLHLGSCM